jgi:hypothetical protein
MLVPSASNPICPVFSATLPLEFFSRGVRNRPESPDASDADAINIKSDSSGFLPHPLRY